MPDDIKLPEPALYVGTKLFPYEQRMFATAGLRESLGYTSSPVEYYTADQVRAAVLADREGRQQDKLDAARWRYIRRKLCLTGNGDGTCAMQAINLPAAIQGWPEPEQVAEFYDAAIDAAMHKEGRQ